MLYYSINAELSPQTFSLVYPTLEQHYPRVPANNSVGSASTGLPKRSTALCLLSTLLYITSHIQSPAWELTFVPFTRRVNS